MARFLEWFCVVLALSFFLFLIGRTLVRQAELERGMRARSAFLRSATYQRSDYLLISR